MPASRLSRRAMSNTSVAPGRVEVRGRLVHDQDRRLHDEHGRDRETLLLPTRQRERRALLEPGEPDRCRAPRSIRAGIASGATPRLSSPNATSSATVAWLSWYSGLSKTTPTERAISRTGVVVASRPATSDASGDRRRQQLRDDAVEAQPERGLAGPVEAHDADAFARRDVEVDAAQRRAHRHPA